jgi:hypothetical protein
MTRSLAHLFAAPAWRWLLLALLPLLLAACANGGGGTGY